MEGIGPSGDLLVTSWGTVWGDVDNDGDEDLYVANGFIPAAAFIANELRASNHLWLNRGDGTFELVSGEASGADDEALGRATAAADFDGDGDLDLALANNGQLVYSFPGDAPRLYRRTGSPGAGEHWVQLLLRGTASNVEGLGARIAAVLDDAAPGGAALRLLRQVRSDPVYLAAPSRVQHVGLGSRTRVDVVLIDWPSGIHQELHDLPADRLYAIAEPQVLVDGVEAPRRVPGGLEAGVRVANRTQAPRPFAVEVSLSVGGGAGGPGAREAAAARVEGVLDPGEVRRVGVALTVPAPALARLRLEGGELTATAHDDLERARDQRVLEVPAR